MPRTTSFGAELKLGNNFNVLKKAREYFMMREDIYISQYYCCTENVVKSEKWISKGDLQRCEICGKKLYQEKEDTNPTFESEGGNQIKQKKHMVFTDSEGKDHYTCYGLQWCFKDVGFKYEKSDNDDDDQEELFKPPEFEEFIPLEKQSVNGLDEEVVKSARMSYQSLVIPFMKKWVYTSIDKMNVLRFVEDINLIEEFFKYFEKPATRKIKQKLYDIIGVYYE